MEASIILPFLLSIAIILMAARVLGSLSRYIGQPRVLGELVAGVILGPTLLNMPDWTLFHDAHIHELVLPFAEFGVLLLMFLIGVEVRLSELAKVGRIALFAGVLGAILPVFMTIPIGIAFGASFDVALFAGVTLAATSVSISAQVLLEIGHLRSKEGNALLATAIIDDILAILLVSITLAVIGGTDAIAQQSISMIILRMSLYIAVALVLSWYVVPLILQRVAKNPTIVQSHGLTTIAIITLLIFAWTAEAFGGVAGITGAFIAGLGFSRLPERAKHDIEEAIGHIAYALLVPIFFVSVGLEINLSTFPISALPLALMLLVVAILSKIIGSGLGARLGGFNQIESLRVGICMISRGEVGLIIATLGLSSGVLQQDDPMYASLFLVILLTTVATPIFVKMIFPKDDEPTHQFAKSTGAST